MGKAQETSLLFSLESLMREERWRVERERDEALERERQRERERAEAAERLARQREAAARQREHEIAERARAAREEEARLAAIREAEIERVRLEERYLNAQRALEQRPSASTVETPAAPNSYVATRPAPPPARPPRTVPVENKRPCRGDPNDPLNPCLNP